MSNFTGVLNSNEIFSSLFNLILSTQVFADNIKGTVSDLVDMARVDGGLYGDQKLYVSTDCLDSSPWGEDAEAANLLELKRPKDPAVQSIQLNQFRKIWVTVDNYLTKRAWGSEGAFSQFNSVVLGWIRETKRIYDSTLYNSFIGTDETSVGRQEISITLPTNADPEKQARMQGASIAESVANLITDLKDISRDFNDYGYLRSYDVGDLMFIWNSEWVNKIRKIDEPTIFHKEGLIDKLGEHVLPARYFGTVNAEGGTTTGSNTTVRALVEKDFGAKHCFPGDLLPNSTAYGENETYTVDNTVMFKVCHKRSVPYMSAFETGTSFFNPRSLTENHYLVFGYNTLEHLKNYPMITVRGV